MTEQLYGANIELASMKHVDVFRYLNQSWTSPYSMFIDMYCDVPTGTYYYSIFEDKHNSGYSAPKVHFDETDFESLDSCVGSEAAVQAVEHFFDLYVLGSRRINQPFLDGFIKRIMEADRLILESNFVSSGGSAPLSSGTL